MSKVLVLRNVRPDMTSYKGFKWPESGYVEAPNWQPTYECGYGLHGLLWGVGSAGYFYDDPSRWLVVEVNEADLLTGQGDLIDKCKFRCGNVVFCGSRDEAIKYLDTHGAADKPVVFSVRTSGNGGQSTSGDYGQSTSGYYGQSTSDYKGQSTSGDYGQSTSGDYGQSTSGDYGQSTSGYKGQSTSGDYGQSTSGDYGQSTSGYKGQSTSGDYGQSTSGEYGQSTSGDYGQSTSGDYGIIVIKHWDAQASRYRLAVGYVGENGIEANVPYCVEDGKLVKVNG